MKCRICGCTEDRACEGGCYWADGDLCSVCFTLRAQLVEYLEIANRATKASVGRLYMEAREVFYGQPITYELSERERGVQFSADADERAGILTDMGISEVVQ